MALSLTFFVQQFESKFLILEKLALITKHLTLQNESAHFQISCMTSSSPLKKSFFFPGFSPLQVQLAILIIFLILQNSNLIDTLVMAVLLNNTQ